MRIHCVIAKSDISTHALTEGDHQPAATGSPVSYFNSRPHGGRPMLGDQKSGNNIISTHALTEGDRASVSDTIN